MSTTCSENIFPPDHLGRPRSRHHRDWHMQQYRLQRGPRTYFWSPLTREKGWACCTVSGECNLRGEDRCIGDVMACSTYTADKEVNMPRLYMIGNAKPTLSFDSTSTLPLIRSTAILQDLWDLSSLSSATSQRAKLLRQAGHNNTQRALRPIHPCY